MFSLAHTGEDEHGKESVTAESLSTALADLDVYSDSVAQRLCL